MGRRLYRQSFELLSKVQIKLITTLVIGNYRIYCTEGSNYKVSVVDKNNTIIPIRLRKDTVSKLFDLAAITECGGRGNNTYFAVTDDAIKHLRDKRLI